MPGVRWLVASRVENSYRQPQEWHTKIEPFRVTFFIGNATQNGPGPFCVAFRSILSFPVGTASHSNTAQTVLTIIHTSVV